MFTLSLYLFVTVVIILAIASAYIFGMAYLVKKNKVWSLLLALFILIYTLCLLIAWMAS